MILVIFVSEHASCKKKQPFKKRSLALLFLFLSIPITVLLTQFQQSFISSAQTILNAPPTFFCLAVGESNKDACASTIFKGDTSLTLHDVPLQRSMTVYYNDTLEGSATYTNTGDLPLKLKNITLAAVSKKSNKRIEFKPGIQNIIVQPGKTITIGPTSYTFKSPDPGGSWEVFSTVTTESGERVDNNQKDIIIVSTACTALRVKELTASDRSNLAALCSKQPSNKLCISRQYCEINGGSLCIQYAPSQEHLDKHLQCDEHIIMPAKEQDFLEELCSVSSDTDACKEFCERTIDSPICPDPNIADENAADTLTQKSDKAVAGISTLAAIGNTNCRPGQQTNKNTGECCKYQGPNLPSGQCPRAPGGAAPQPGGTAPQPVTNPGGSSNPQTCTTYSQKEKRCCPSTVKNNADQCCAVNGKLKDNGRCPTKPGGGGAPTTRVERVGTTVVRGCTAGRKRDRNGVCYTPTNGGGVPAPARGCGLAGQSCPCCESVATCGLGNKCVQKPRDSIRPLPANCVAGNYSSGTCTTCKAGYWLATSTICRPKFAKDAVCTDPRQCLSNNCPPPLLIIGNKRCK